MNIKITTIYQDNEYTGEYFTRGNMITAIFDGKKKQTQIDGFRGNESALADILLTHLVRESLAERK